MGMMVRIALATLATLATCAQAADRVWATAFGGYMSIPLNWQGGIVPQDGDRVIFPALVNGSLVINDLPMRVFDGLVVDAPPGDPIVFQGDFFFFSGPIAVQAIGNVVFTGNVLNRAPTRIELVARPDRPARLTIGSAIVGGSMTFAKTGTGYAQLDLGSIGQGDIPPERVAFDGIDLAQVKGGVAFEGDIASTGPGEFVIEENAFGRGTGASYLRARANIIGKLEPFDASETIILGADAGLWLKMDRPGTLRGVLQMEGNGTLTGWNETTVSSWIRGFGMLETSNVSTLLNPANDWSGGLRIKSPYTARLSEVIPDGNALHVASQYNPGASLETVRDLVCEAGGTMVWTSPAGLLTATGTIDLAQCDLSFAYDPAVDYSAHEEVTLIRNLGTARATGQFRNAPQGTPFTINGVRLYLSYRGGPDGRDVALGKSSICAPAPDFNRDCTTDIVRAGAGSGGVLEMVANGARASNIVESPFVRITHAADINGDGEADLLGVSLRDNSILFALGGRGASGWVQLLAGGSGWFPKLTGDFNGDGHADILWEHTDGSSAIWLMRDNLQVGGRRLFGGGTGWSATLVADFNGDGRDDILWTHVDGRVAMWLLDGITQTGAAVLLPGGTGWRAVLKGDYDGDGKADIQWEHADGSSALWLMDGTRQAGGGRLFGAGTGWFAKAIGDLDGNGKSDIAWQHVDGRVAIWLMDGFRQIGAASFTPAVAGLTLVKTGDANGDGKADLILERNDGTVDFWMMDGAARIGTGSIAPPAGTESYRLLR